jgi:hypothetical protein
MGTLFVAGHSVIVNGQTAPNRMSIRSGDTVATGSTSSALVRLRGGSVQLDENTNLSFLDHIGNYLGCTLITTINTGQIFSEGENVCASAGGVLFAAQSKYLVKRISEGEVLAAVAEGKVTISGAEQTLVATALTQASIVGGRISEQHPISEAELHSITGWRNQYAFKSASGGTSPAAPVRAVSALTPVR